MTIMMQGFGHGMGIGMGWGWIIGLLVLVLIIWLVVRSTAASTNDTANPQEEKETPLDLLKKRYARGEISKDEFNEKKRDIVT
jgi:putative membrane protein